MSKVFTNAPGDQGSIPGRVIPKTQKMVFDAFFLNTQHYKVRIKDKVEQSRNRSSTLPYTSVYSYWIESLQVTLDYSPQLYFTYKKLNNVTPSLDIIENFKKIIPEK